MNISNKETTNRSDTHKDDKNIASSTSQKVKESMNDESPKWDEQKDMYKHHGDKEGDKGKHVEEISSQSQTEARTDQFQDDANAEFVDHQDINETNDDDFAQPRPMSDGLSSIYPGRPSTREDREALAKERQAKMNEPGTRHSQPSPEPDRSEGESHEATNVKDNSLQGKLGIARGEVPSGHRDPNFSPGRQNYWGDEVEDDEILGDHDNDDQEVKRKQDEGARPWDTASDYESEYDMDDYDERDRKPRNRRRQQEDEFSRQSYKHKSSARAFHKDRKQHYTDENE